VKKRKAHAAKSKREENGRKLMRKNVIGLTLCAVLLALS
jgi:hypothetical protein